jgi:CspA family cold shock protein
MGKGRDFRGPRRRGFDDDFPPPDFGAPAFRPPRPPGGFAPRPQPVAEGPELDATVKWFNPEKGFGFVEMADGSGDAFLHVAVLQSAGHDSVAPGAKVKVQVGQGQKGRQVTRVADVQPGEAPPPRFGGGGGGPRFGGGDRFGGGGGFGGPRPRMPRQAPDPSTAVDVSGKVKWFNGQKGFGFVAADDGGKDVFVHISVLERAGLATLDEGQPVSMKVVDTPKGREAISLSA